MTKYKIIEISELLKESNLDEEIKVEVMGKIVSPLSSHFNFADDYGCFTTNLVDFSLQNSLQLQGRKGFFWNTRLEEKLHQAFKSQPPLSIK